MEPMPIVATLVFPPQVQCIYCGAAMYSTRNAVYPEWHYVHPTHDGPATQKCHNDSLRFKVPTFPVNVARERSAASWIGGNRDIDPYNPEDVKAWQERDRQAAEQLKPAPEDRSPVMFDASGAMFVQTQSGPGAHDDRADAAALAGTVHAMPTKKRLELEDIEKLDQLRAQIRREGYMHAIRDALNVIEDVEDMNVYGAAKWLIRSGLLDLRKRRQDEERAERRNQAAGANQESDPARRVQPGSPGGAQEDQNMDATGLQGEQSSGSARHVRDRRIDSPASEGTSQAPAGQPQHDHLRNPATQAQNPERLQVQTAVPEVAPGLYGTPVNMEPFRPSPSACVIKYEPEELLYLWCNQPESKHVGEKLYCNNSLDPDFKFSPDIRKAKSVTITRELPVEEAKKYMQYVMSTASPTHYPGGDGPHLLRDSKGNTAYCGGPGKCEFCLKGVPATVDHGAIEVGSIFINIIDKQPQKDGAK